MKFPDGNRRRVCVSPEAFSVKAGHWETEKAKLSGCGNIRVARESEDLH